jgi:hypothetical protein
MVRDDKPRTRDRDDRGYGLPLVTTDVESSAEDLVARYASRWGIEQAFADARQIIGVVQARNRTRRAVEQTVKLRRFIIAARFRNPCPEQATPQETRAVLAAWAAAGT